MKETNEIKALMATTSQEKLQQVILEILKRLDALEKSNQSQTQSQSQTKTKN